MPRLPEIPLKFSLSELAGSLGDFGTIIPLILAVALVSDVNVRYVLLFFGIWFILTGLYYRLPIPLEPMKAVAVIVIAGGISSGEIAASGLILGVIFLALGYGRFFEIIDKWVPQSVVRGIQLGLALLLFKASAGFVIKDTFFFILGIGIVIVFLILFRYRRVPDLSSLCVIGAGLIGGLFLHGIPPISLIPAPQLVIPLSTDFSSAFSTLVLPQVVLTIANAILATSLLTKDLFQKDVPPKKFSTTIGVMNLVSVPFGGFPMCHGAGGLAGQYPVRGKDRRSECLCRSDFHPARPFLHFPAGPFHYCSRGLGGSPGLCRSGDGQAQSQDRFDTDNGNNRNTCFGHIYDPCFYQRYDSCLPDGVDWEKTSGDEFRRTIIKDRNPERNLP